MRPAHRRLAVSVTILALASACAEEAPRFSRYDGRQHITQRQANTTVACGPLPLEVDVSRGSLSVVGPCRHVIVAGSHNDVTVDVSPGGLIEITGNHNDVTWRRVGRGPRPALVDRGRSNSFHWSGGEEG